MTNKEWLYQTMSDEELIRAMLIHDVCNCCIYNHGHCERPKGKLCADGIGNYLKKEHKDDK